VLWSFTGNAQPLTDNWRECEAGNSATVSVSPVTSLSSGLAGGPSGPPRASRDALAGDILPYRMGFARGLLWKISGLADSRFGVDKGLISQAERIAVAADSADSECQGAECPPGRRRHGGPRQGAECPPGRRRHGGPRQGPLSGQDRMPGCGVPARSETAWRAASRAAERPGPNASVRSARPASSRAAPRAMAFAGQRANVPVLRARNPLDQLGEPGAAVDATRASG
jgi:hypothetical protein